MISKNKYNNKKSLVSILLSYNQINDEDIYQLSRRTLIPVQTIIKTLDNLVNINKFKLENIIYTKVN